MNQITLTNLRLSLTIVCLFGLSLLPLIAYSLAFESAKEAQAFKSGNLKEVKRLIEKEDFFRGQSNYVVVEALAYAIQSGNFELIKYLKDQGWLDICQAQNTCFPIHYAAYNDFGTSQSMLNLFIEHDFNPREVDQGGYTPLHYAARNGHPEVVKYLCRHGVDVTIKDNYSKETALELAKRDLSTARLSSNPEEESLRRAGLKKVIAYIESGACEKDSEENAPDEHNMSN